MIYESHHLTDSSTPSCWGAELEGKWFKCLHPARLLGSDPSAQRSGNVIIKSMPQSRYFWTPSAHAHLCMCGFLGFLLLNRSTVHSREIIVLLTTDIAEISWYLHPYNKPLLIISDWPQCVTCLLRLCGYPPVLGKKAQMSVVQAVWRGSKTYSKILSDVSSFTPEIPLYETRLLGLFALWVRREHPSHCRRWQRGYGAPSLTFTGLVAFCPTWDKVAGGMLDPPCPPQPAPTAKWAAASHEAWLRSAVSGTEYGIRLTRRHLHLRSLQREYWKQTGPQMPSALSHGHL